DASLSELGESPAASVSLRAMTVLRDHRLQREFKAMYEVIDLGGRLFHLSSHGGGQDLIFISQEMILRGYRWDGKLGIQIDETWHHTRDALEKVKRISELESIYLIKGAPLTREELIELQVALPQVVVQNRGTARLGVTHGNIFFGTGKGAPVGDVNRDSGAAKAGIRTGDSIIRVGDYDITDFESLVRSLENYSAGDVVEVDILRGIEKLTLEVELGGW
ncbi:MAG: hypothetical protein CMJ46_02435, partial [Planctomyces sp.]|nr:hypothetical protein [Planctomyces sp.]